MLDQLKILEQPKTPLSNERITSAKHVRTGSLLSILCAESGRVYQNNLLKAY